MVIVLFTLLSVEVGRVAVNFHMYANRKLVKLDPHSRRVTSAIATLGIVLDAIGLTISIFLIVVGFGSFASLLVAYGATGYVFSTMKKARVIVAISRINQHQISYS